MKPAATKTRTSRWPDPGIHRALSTALEWRRDPALAVDLDDGALVEANHPGQALGWRPGGAGPPSRTIMFGGQPLRLLARTLGQRDPVANIPSIVIDMMLRSIVEAHFAVWYVWHVPTGAIFAPGMRELLGIPESEVPTIVEEWLGRVHPDDLPRMVAENDLSLRTNSAFRSEYRFRHGQGGYISISDWGIVLSGEDGQAEWMAGGLRDITVEKNLAQAREEAAQLREVLFRKSLIPAFLLDGDGVFLDASQSALALLQVERETLVGRPGGEFLPARLVDGIRAPGLREEPRTDALGPMEVELKVAGRRKWLLATVMPFSVGEARMACVLAADVTEARRASEALGRSEASLREKKEALERHNVALRVLIDQRRNDFVERRRVLTENLEQLVYPILDRMAQAFSDREEVALLDVVRQTLQDIANPLLESRDAPLERSQGLSRREYEILQLVRAGRTTEEIARSLYISAATVTFHRCNIRRKLGLHNSGMRLTPRVDARSVLHPQEPILP
jgi:PAS domain S-box-containing protein